MEPGVGGEAVPRPEGRETFLLCRSHVRQTEERAIHKRFPRRMDATLTKRAHRMAQAERLPHARGLSGRVGRILGRNARAAALFDVQGTTAPEVDRAGLRGHWT